MKTDTREKILQFIRNHPKITAKEIIDYFDISKQAVFKHLKTLGEQQTIVKTGKPPRVYYSVTVLDSIKKKYAVKPQIIKYIEQRFMDITPTGEIDKGWPAFLNWCLKRKLPIESSANQYIQINKKYDSWRKNGLLDGQQKMNNTFTNVYLDKVYYLDFYSIEQFGKTTLGKTLLYAKQSQDKTLIKLLVEEIRPRIEEIIVTQQIEAVGFIPPTVKREVQFMKELQRLLRLKTPKINIIKIKTPIIIPQKTLTKLEDRIENAKHTFVVTDTISYKNILLIDDAVGSGATLNEIAHQIKIKRISAGKIIGLAITGSLKGFDIISEI